MRPTTCKHYNGTYHNEKCLAGVCYHDVTPEPNRSGHGLRLPCHSKIILSNPTPEQLAEFKKRGTCEKFELPTKSEIEAEEAAMRKRMEETMVAREAIVKHLGGPWKRGMRAEAGEIKCPICKKGKLRFSRAGYNGHIHAACTTEDCVRWIE